MLDDSCARDAKCAQGPKPVSLGEVVALRLELVRDEL